jgi:D-psicose/D-tagatose/L-ribulose 3-epimerase
MKQLHYMGYDGVEFPMFALDASPWKVLGEACSDSGLGRTVVACLPKGANLLSDVAGERAAGVDYLRGCIDNAVALGADRVVGPMYAPVGLLVGRGPNAEENARAAEGFQAVGAYAASAGLALSIESLNRFETYFLNSQEQAAALVDAVGLPGVGMLYDTFHANIEEKNPVAAVGLGGARINHVHVAANDRATPGHDHVPYRETFRALKTSGYDGWLTIEAFGDYLPDIAGATCIWRKMFESQEQLARDGLQFIRETWEKA